MIFHPTSLSGSFTIEPEAVQDERGWFARYYCANEFKKIGHDKEWVQMNHSFTHSKGSIRGMHFQLDPFREIKLVRCISGAVFDVIIDLRKDSPGFLNWFGAELSSANKKMMYIPEGFAHGFQTLSNDCELLYHHSAFYLPDKESGIRYNDPRINIEWPLAVTVVSDKDKQHELIDDHFKGI